MQAMQSQNSTGVTPQTAPVNASIPTAINNCAKAAWKATSYVGDNTWVHFIAKAKLLHKRQDPLSNPIREKPLAGAPAILLLGLNVSRAAEFLTKRAEWLPFVTLAD